MNTKNETEVSVRVIFKKHKNRFDKNQSGFYVGSRICKPNSVSCFAKATQDDSHLSPSCVTATL